MDIYSLGLNWWLARRAQFGVDYRHIFSRPVRHRRRQLGAECAANVLMLD